MAALVALQQKTVGVGQTVEKCNNQPILEFIEPRSEHSFFGKHCWSYNNNIKKNFIPFSTCIKC